MGAFLENDVTALTVVLVVLAALIASTVVSKLLPWNVPRPILQIVIGAGLSSVIGFELVFEPHVFLLLFIPPLLFLDGWRIPKGALFQNWKPIATMSVGLVIFTVAAMGYLIHWLLPAIPLAAAFALAAILSPTDPVAVGAMTANSPLPSRLMHILEGESLLNDATGLVCFTFAVGAVLTDSFSALQASASFVLIAGGGVLTGLAVTWLIGGMNRVLVKRTGEEPSLQILVSLMIPFAAYLIGEHLHVSGILAAAVGGVAMHYMELSGPAMAITRTQRTAVWDTIQAALNGSIFLLLGAQLPQLIGALPAVATDIGVDTQWDVLWYIVLITLCLGLIRFAWVVIYHIVSSVVVWSRERRFPDFQLRLLAIKATAGVRGAITLAGIMTLPVALVSGEDFPVRDALIAISMGVIICSLLIASVGIPVLTKGICQDLHHGSDEETSEASARVSAAEAAVRRIEESVVDDPSLNDVAAHVLGIYRRRLEYGDSGPVTMIGAIRAERALRLQALRAEREHLIKMRRARIIDCTLLRKLVREIDMIEVGIIEQSHH